MPDDPGGLQRTGEAAISASNLWYRFADTAANRGLSFTVERGSVTCILGPNGAGKTTLVRQLVGILRPERGMLHVLGTDVAVEPVRVQQLCSYLPQSGIPFLDMDVVQAIAACARLRTDSWHSARAAAEAQLECWDLVAERSRRIRRLSMGQRRLVSLACTFANACPIVVLDEPTNDLDPLSRIRVWRTLRERCASGQTVLLVTHNIKEAESVATDVLIMQRGEIATRGSVAALCARQNQLEVGLRVVTSDRGLGAGGMPAGRVCGTLGDSTLLRVPRPEAPRLLSWLNGCARVVRTEVIEGGASLEDVFLTTLDRDGIDATGRGVYA